MDSPLILSLGLASQSGSGIESIRLPSPWIRPPPSWDWHLRFGGVVHGIESSVTRSEEHTSELQSLMRISYAAFCWNTTKHSGSTTTNICNPLKTQQECKPR